MSIYNKIIDFFYRWYENFIEECNNQGDGDIAFNFSGIVD
jgi:hypothetical protein